MIIFSIASSVTPLIMGEYSESCNERVLGDAVPKTLKHYQRVDFYFLALF